MTASARGFVLCYHSVDPSGSVISVSPAGFREHMKLLAASGRPVVTLSDVQAVPGAIAITFDDAFQNFYREAFPVLAEYGFPATVFAVSGHMGGTNNWATQPTGIPAFPLMTWKELMEVSDSGVDVGAHTVTHPHLPALSDADIDRELRESKESIQDHLGKPVITFAYPYGDVDVRVRNRAGEAFRWSCGTVLDYLSSSSQAAELPRIDAFYVRDPQRFRALVDGKGESYIRTRRLLRRIRATATS